MFEAKEEESIQICSFMWADNFWIISHPKKHLEQMLKDLIGEPAKVDFGAQASKLVVDKHIRF